MKIADVVAYVNAKKIKSVDSVGEDADCENNTGTGYCLYLLTADIKEDFKGNVETDMLEFYISSDASYPKNRLLGEQIVFLVRGKNEKDLGTIENSTRSVEKLEIIRKIKDSKTPVDENDEFNPYSSRSLKNDFKAADVVIYANVMKFSSVEDGLSPQGYILEADVKEVFKGGFKAKQKIEYRDDLLYRPFRKADLGEQIIYFRKK